MSRRNLNKIKRGLLVIEETPAKPKAPKAPKAPKPKKAKAIEPIAPVETVETPGHTEGGDTASE